MDPTERRRHSRTRTRLAAAVVRRSGVETFEVVDVSYSGLFAHMAKPPLLMELIKVRVHLPARALDIHVVSVRIVKVDSPTLHGVGMRFFALNGADRRDWDVFIASLLLRPRAA